MHSPQVEAVSSPQYKEPDGDHPDYVYLTDFELVMDYIVNNAMPICDMDKEIRQFDRAINTHAQRAEEHHRVLDEAIAEDVARGADDKED